MAKSRRSYKGAAVANTIKANIADNSTSIELNVALSGWATGSEPFFVVIDPGTAKEEKMCVIYVDSTHLTVVDPASTSSWSSNTAGRGVDDTTARAHDAGAVIYPVLTAREANEANELIAKYAHQGAIVHQGSSTFTELQIGTAGQVLKVNSGATAPEWGTVGSAGIADGSVTTDKIAADAITSAKIAADAVGSSEIAANAVTASEIASDAVTTAKILDSNVTTAKIADANITNAKLNNGSSGDIALVTVSTSDPTGGKNGDIWVKVV